VVLIGSAVERTYSKGRGGFRTLRTLLREYGRMSMVSRACSGVVGGSCDSPCCYRAFDMSSIRHPFGTKPDFVLDLWDFESSDQKVAFATHCTGCYRPAPRSHSRHVAPIRARAAQASQLFHFRICVSFPDLSLHSMLMRDFCNPTRRCGSALFCSFSFRLMHCSIRSLQVFASLCGPSENHQPYFNTKNSKQQLFHQG
jgi:hypothetical protein